VKCRIGIDARDDYEFFHEFAATMAAAGVDALIVHARAAILGGLSPKENREIPPLQYGHVHRLKRELPQLPVVLNGGLHDVPAVLAQLQPNSSAALDGITAALDGIMVGRAVYHRPAFLAELQRVLIDPSWATPGPAQIIERMVAYARQQRRGGVRLHALTRHMHGLIAGCEGARAWRRFLSEAAAAPDAEPEILYAALPMLGSKLALCA
jgi:tRNA-dihydrouridine synthase A